MHHRRSRGTEKPAYLKRVRNLAKSDPNLNFSFFGTKWSIWFGAPLPVHGTCYLHSRSEDSNFWGDLEIFADHQGDPMPLYRVRMASEGPLTDYVKWGNRLTLRVEYRLFFYKMRNNTLLVIFGSSKHAACHDTRREPGQTNYHHATCCVFST